MTKLNKTMKNNLFVAISFLLINFGATVITYINGFRTSMGSLLMFLAGECFAFLLFVNIK